MKNNAQRLISSKFIFYSLALIIILFFLAILSSSFQAQVSHRNGDVEQATSLGLRVAVKRQPDSPILIKFLRVDETIPDSPQIEFMVINISDKPIRAYTIRYEARIGSSNSSGMTLTNINNSESILNPGQFRSESLSSLPSSTIPVSQVALMVDYVEFLEGVAWGPDIHNSAELLTGQRAGARAEAEYLLGLLKSRGPFAVIESYKSSEQDITLPSGYSQKWVDGFLSGRDTVRARLQHTIKKGSMDEIKSELQKPFDLSERR